MKEKFENYRINIKELKRFAEEYRMFCDLERAIKTFKTELADKTRYELEEEKTRLCKKVSRILKEKRAIEKEIDNVKDGNEAMILRYRYIDGYAWEEISELMNYSPRNIHYMHKKALMEIAN